MTRWILGIDPSLTGTGIAVIQASPEGHSFGYSERIVTKKEWTMVERLRAIGLGLDYILRYNVQSGLLVAMETPFAGANSKTGLSLGMVRGVLLYVLGDHGLPEPEKYAPAQVKLEVTGSGRADKEMMRQCVTELVHDLPKKKLTNDEIDALAVAITHARRVGIAARRALGAKELAGGQSR